MSVGKFHDKNGMNDEQHAKYTTLTFNADFKLCVALDRQTFVNEIPTTSLDDVNDFSNMKTGKKSQV